MINFSRIPINSRIGRMLRALLRLVPAETPLRVLQGPLRGARWIPVSATHGCWLGSYEGAKQKVFARTISRGDILFDVGANVGYYSLLASRKVRPDGKVYAFEPLPRNLDYLRHHLALNAATNVDIIPVAVSASDGTASFAIAPRPEMGSLSKTGDLTVQTRSLDSLVFAGEVSPPTWIKMDIEGGEAAALEGARRTLETYRPGIFLATHGADVHAACVRILDELGYALEPLDAPDVRSARELVARTRS